MADDVVLPFVIEQLAGRDRKKITLDDHDAPFGSPRKQPMFRLGGRNERNVVRLDGRPTPIVHTKFTIWHPVELKGHLRDHFTGDDGAAREKGEQLLQILDDQVIVKLSCGPWTWTAFPDDFQVDVEGLNDFAYSLRFDILSRPGFQHPAPKDDMGLLDGFATDAADEAQALLDEQRGQLLAQQLAVDTFVAMNTLADSLDTALDDLRDVAVSFDNAGKQADAESKALSAKAQQVKDRCDEWYEALSTLGPDDALTATSEDAVAAFQDAQLQMMLQLDECKVTMRSMQLTARKRISSGGAVYVVGPGDTLESIAAAELGTDARAYDLGLRPQDLRPGRKIALPK